MIILIGGAEYTGKTYMAHNLLEKYKISYLSIDHIKMGLIRGTSSCEFTSLDSTEKISKYLWPIIKGIILTNIENKQNIIIEGCYMPPEEVVVLHEKYPGEIISLYIIFSEEYIIKNFEKSILPFRNIIEQRQYKDDTDLNVYIEEHKKIKDLCIRHGAKYIEIENNYSSEINLAYQWLEKRIKSLN